MKIFIWDNTLFDFLFRTEWTLGVYIFYQDEQTSTLYLLFIPFHTWNVKTG